MNALALVFGIAFSSSVFAADGSEKINVKIDEVSARCYVGLSVKQCLAGLKLVMTLNQKNPTSIKKFIDFLKDKQRVDGDTSDVRIFISDSYFVPNANAGPGSSGYTMFVDYKSSTDELQKYVDAMMRTPYGDCKPSTCNSTNDMAAWKYQ
jgi:hypothetical protein